MRTALLALASLLTVGVVLPGPATADSSAAVTLRVAPNGFVIANHWVVDQVASVPSTWLIDPVTNPAFNGLPGVAGCEVTAFDGDGDFVVDGGDVLDAAVSAGCISGWSAIDTAFGRFVACVDDLCQVGDGLVTWWYLLVNGFGSPVGIDDVNFQDGMSMEFVYWVGPL